MTTLVVFAEFWRDVPLVRCARSSEFTLLFNQSDDNVRVRSQWDPGHDPADFVLLVRNARRRGGRRSWSVETHKDSPADLVERLSSFQTTVTSNARSLTAGSVFSFSFNPVVFRKEIRLMLCGLEPIKRELRKIPVMPMSFEKLPKEVIYKIVDSLPWRDVVYTLPFVSESLFKVAKTITGPWFELRFGTTGFVPITRELVAICQAARQTCVSLSAWDLTPSGESSLSTTEAYLQQAAAGLVTDHFVNLFSSDCWPKVSKLHWNGEARGLHPICLQHGLRKRNFESLTEMMLMVDGVPLGWDVFHGCKLPVLTTLMMSLSAKLKPGMKSKFAASFPKLRTVDITVESLECWDNLLPLPATDEGGSGTGNHVPQLKSLSVTGLSPDIHVVERELAAFWGESVTHLEFAAALPFQSGTFVPGSHEAELCGDLILSLFPGTVSLKTDGEVAVCWTNATDFHLQQIESLEHGPYGPVPYHRMLNLKRLVIANDNKAVTVPLSDVPLQGLFDHPQLMQLHMNLGYVVFDSFDISHGSTSGNVTKLHLGFKEADLDETSCEGLRPALTCFPALRCLSLRLRELQTTAQIFATVLAENALNLVHLTLEVRPKKIRAKCKGAKRERMLLRLRNLGEDLPGGWTGGEAAPGLFKYFKSGQPKYDHTNCF